jgi:hypothetical protein
MVYLGARRKYGIYELLFRKYKYMFEDEIFFVDSPVPVAGQDAVISCPTGWFIIINDMLGEIHQLIQKEKMNLEKIFKIFQIKEKWCELNVQLVDNVNSLDDIYQKKIGSIIKKYVEKATSTCFNCGNLKKLNEYSYGGRFCLLCFDCAESLNAEKIDIQK